MALLQARIQAAGRGEVHVLWQIIPFFILTTSEVLVSVTGLEFAYTQAPRAMKSTIMGFWLLCVTLATCWWLSWRRSRRSRSPRSSGFLPA